MRLVSLFLGTRGALDCLLTYHHAELDLLSAILLLDCLVQDDVQEDVVAAQNADDLATAIQLNEQPLVEVLQHIGVSMRAPERGTRGSEWEGRASEGSKGNSGCGSKPTSTFASLSRGRGQRTFLSSG